MRGLSAGPRRALVTRMLSLRESELLAALAEVMDPEIPTCSVLDLGMVEGVEASGGTVTVRMLPTFSGCPALGLIRRTVTERVRQVPGVESVRVDFLLSPVWSTDRITPAGQEALRRLGIAPPGAAPGGCGAAARLASVGVACPYCGSQETRLENPFGPTRCRALYYCERCQNPFEHMKEI